MLNSKFNSEKNKEKRDKHSKSHTKEEKKRIFDVMPQNLISVCALSLTSGIYWVELGFINNCKKPQL
jgi:cytoskeletal protein RodZ